MPRPLSSALAIVAVLATLGFGAGPALADDTVITPFSGGATGCCRQIS